MHSAWSRLRFINAVLGRGPDTPVIAWNTPPGSTTAEASRRRKRDRSRDVIGRPEPPWDNRASRGWAGGALATSELLANGVGSVGWIWGCYGLIIRITCYHIGS